MNTVNGTNTTRNIPVIKAAAPAYSHVVAATFRIGRVVKMAAGGSQTRAETHLRPRRILLPDGDVTPLPRDYAVRYWPEVRARC